MRFVCVDVTSPGNTACEGVRRASPSVLTCTFPPSVVNRYNVAVSFAGNTTAESVSIDRLCGAGFYGSVGDACTACPQVGTRTVRAGDFKFAHWVRYRYWR